MLVSNVGISGQQGAKTEDVLDKQRPSPRATELPGNLRGFRLLGVSKSPGEDGLVIFADRSNNRTYYLRLGDAIGDTGVVIKNIQEDRLVLSYRGEETEMEIAK